MHSMVLRTANTYNIIAGARNPREGLIIDALKRHISAHRRVVHWGLTGRSSKPFQSKHRSTKTTLHAAAKKKGTRSIEAMAVGRGVEERLLRQFWETGNLSHRQCVKNLLQLMEVGDIDPKIPGLPSCPRRDKFDYKCLNR